MRNSLEGYFRDLRGTEPEPHVRNAAVKVVEKPLLEVVMAKEADQNQSKATMQGWA